MTSIPVLARDGPMGTSSTEAEWLQIETLCAANPAVSSFSHLCDGSSPGQQSTEPANASLFSLLLVRATVRTKLCRAKVLIIAEMGGLLYYFAGQSVQFLAREGTCVAS